MRKLKNWWQKINDKRMAMAARRPYARELKRLSSKLRVVVEDLSQVSSEEKRLAERIKTLKSKRLVIKRLIASAQEKLDAIK